MDYQVKSDDGKLISYKLIGHSGIPVEVKMQEYRLPMQKILVLKL